jgi:dipeptidase
MNEYDPRSAYWNFRIVTNLVNLFYTATKDEVIPIWREWEEINYRLQPAVEKTAMELYIEDPALAVEFLTTYSCAKASEALNMAKEMTVKLHSIIAHYNAPL